MSKEYRFMIFEGASEAEKWTNEMSKQGYELESISISRGMEKQGLVVGRFEPIREIIVAVSKS